MTVKRASRLCRLAGIVVCAVFMIAGAANAASPTVILRLLPDTALPGVPVAMQVSVTNTSTADLKLVNFASLRATGPAGNAFVTSRQDEPLTPPLTSEDDPQLTLHPGDNRDFYYAIDATGCKPSFFADVRFRAPGKFRLQLILNPHDEGDPAPDNSLASNEAILTVSDSKGDDAEIYRRMQALFPDAGWGCTLLAMAGPMVADDAQTKFSGSGYVPYLALLPSPGFESADSIIARLEKVESTNPAGPIGDLVALRLGEVHTNQVGEQLTAGNPLSAADHATRARTILDALSRTSRYPFIAAGARNLLNDLPTASQVLLQYADHLLTAPPAPQKVIPIALCVDAVPGDARFITRFAYNNPNTVGKNLPVGPLNAFSPPPLDQGQPRFFSPGRNDNAVGAVSTGPVIWSLDGSSATAQPGSTPACASDGALPVRPFVDCIQKGDDAVVVWFGYENPNTYPVRTPAGRQNHVEPASAAAGQVTIFLPGFHRDAWKATLRGSGSIAWTLGTNSVSASAAQGFKCSGNERGDD